LFRSILSVDGAAALIEYEAVLSIATLLGIGIDAFGSNYLARSHLSATRRARQAMGTIICARAVLWCLAIAIFLPIAYETNLTVEATASAVGILATAIIDFPGLWAREGRFHRYNQAQVMRTGSVVIAVHFGAPPLAAYAVTSLVVAIVLLLTSRTNPLITGRAMRLAPLFLRRTAIPTGTEFVTALHSQLDAWAVATFFPSGISVWYLAIRKLVRGCLQVPTPLFRIILARSRRAAERRVDHVLAVTAAISVSSWLALAITLPWLLGFLVSGRDLPRAILISSYIYSTLVLMGTLKASVVHRFLMTPRYYTLNATLTIVGLVLFSTGLIGAYMFNSVLLLFAARVLADSPHALQAVVFWKEGKW
jgi:hypothetical protein